MFIIHTREIFYEIIICIIILRNNYTRVRSRKNIILYYLIFYIIQETISVKKRYIFVKRLFLSNVIHAYSIY